MTDEYGGIRTPTFDQWVLEREKQQSKQLKNEAEFEAAKKAAAARAAAAAKKGGSGNG